MALPAGGCCALFLSIFFFFFTFPNFKKVDSAFSSDVSSSCADSECRNVGRAAEGAVAAPAARSGRRLLSPARQQSPGSCTNSLVSLPEVVEAAAAAAAAAATAAAAAVASSSASLAQHRSSSKPAVAATRREQKKAASSLPPRQITMFARNKSSRSCSRTRAVDASITQLVDHPVCTIHHHSILLSRSFPHFLSWSSSSISCLPFPSSFLIYSLW